MKTFALLSILCISSICSAQPGAMGPGPGSPSFGGATTKLFGETTNFSASMQMQIKGDSGEEPMIVPGKISVADGKSRFEMSLTEAKGGRFPPGAGEQMKAMGMDRIVTISRPDKKATYMIYPGLQAYVEMPLHDPDAGKSESDFEIELTELGKETIDGHACVKNKAVVTDKEGKSHESIVWNAADLKKFPLKMELNESGTAATLTFKDVKFAKPESALFDPPSDYTKYDNMMTMMQQMMMKRMGQPNGGSPRVPTDQ